MAQPAFQRARTEENKRQRAAALVEAARSLAQETGVPLPTAQKLMGQLAGVGLLTSVRGAGGGFALARPAQNISLADIVEAVEGPIASAPISAVTGMISASIWAWKGMMPAWSSIGISNTV